MRKHGPYASTLKPCRRCGRVRETNKSRKSTDLCRDCFYLSGWKCPACGRVMNPSGIGSHRKAHLARGVKI